MPANHSANRSRRLPAAIRNAGVLALVFAGLAALFYAPVLLGVRTFPDGDFTHHFLPFSIFQQEEMLAGSGEYPAGKISFGKK